jgi:hypothetical protein
MVPTGEILVGMRIERPILVPFDRRAIAGRLHVEFAGVETQAAPQVGQQFAIVTRVGRVDRARWTTNDDNIG